MLFLPPLDAPSPTIGTDPWRDTLQHALDATPMRPAEPGLALPTFTVLSVSACGGGVEAELRFHAGLTYCCMEHGCYVAAYDPKWWRRLRLNLAQLADREPPRMSLRVRTTVEPGARFLNLGNLNLAAERGYVFEHAPQSEP